MTSIGFIGLGHMGKPMVRNLLNAGYSVKVYDVSTEAMLALKQFGAQPVSDLKELVKDTATVFTMLQTSEQVLKTCLGEAGLFSLFSPNTLYIDSSSIEIKATQELHAQAKGRNFAMLDAPVSGGVGGAEAGTLTIMVGGEEKNFERAKPLLMHLGKKLVHAGAAGCGQAAKICNNLILGISMIAVCEGFNLAEKLGLDPKKFFEISSNASGQCWSMTSYCPVPDIIDKSPANQNYEPGFMAKMMLKDLHLAQDAAEQIQALIPMGAVASELYSLYVSQGNGDKDFSGIINMIKGK